MTSMPFLVPSVRTLPGSMTDLRAEDYAGRDSSLSGTRKKVGLRGTGMARGRDCR